MKKEENEKMEQSGGKVGLFFEDNLIEPSLVCVEYSEEKQQPTAFFNLFYCLKPTQSTVKKDKSDDNKRYLALKQIFEDKIENKQTSQVINAWRQFLGSLAENCQGQKSFELLKKVEKNAQLNLFMSIPYLNEKVTVNYYIENGSDKWNKSQFKNARLKNNKGELKSYNIPTNSKVHGLLDYDFIHIQFETLGETEMKKESCSFSRNTKAGTFCGTTEGKGLAKIEQTKQSEQSISYKEIRVSDSSIFVRFACPIEVKLLASKIIGISKTTKMISSSEQCWKSSEVHPKTGDITLVWCNSPTLSYLPGYELKKMTISVETEREMAKIKLNLGFLKLPKDCSELKLILPMKDCLVTHLEVKSDEQTMVFDKMIERPDKQPIQDEVNQAVTQKFNEDKTEENYTKLLNKLKISNNLSKRNLIGCLVVELGKSSSESVLARLEIITRMDLQFSGPSKSIVEYCLKLPFLEEVPEEIITIQNMTSITNDIEFPRDRKLSSNQTFTTNQVRDDNVFEITNEAVERLDFNCTLRPDLPGCQISCHMQVLLNSFFVAPDYRNRPEQVNLHLFLQQKYKETYSGYWTKQKREKPGVAEVVKKFLKHTISCELSSCKLSLHTFKDDPAEIIHSTAEPKDIVDLNTADKVLDDAKVSEDRSTDYEIDFGNCNNDERQEIIIVGALDRNDTILRRYHEWNTAHKNNKCHLVNIFKDDTFVREKNIVRKNINNHTQYFVTDDSQTNFYEEAKLDHMLQKGPYKDDDIYLKELKTKNQYRRLVRVLNQVIKPTYERLPTVKTLNQTAVKVGAVNNLIKLTPSIVSGEPKKLLRHEETINFTGDLSVTDNLSAELQTTPVFRVPTLKEIDENEFVSRGETLQNMPENQPILSRSSVTVDITKFTPLNWYSTFNNFKNKRQILDPIVRAKQKFLFYHHQLVPQSGPSKRAFLCHDNMVDLDGKFFMLEECKQALPETECRTLLNWPKDQTPAVKLGFFS